jgi:hypothetical protein
MPPAAAGIGEAGPALSATEIPAEAVILLIDVPSFKAKQLFGCSG